MCVCFPVAKWTVADSIILVSVHMQYVVNKEKLVQKLSTLEPVCGQPELWVVHVCLRAPDFFPLSS